LRAVAKASSYLENFDKLTINVISYFEILRGLKDLGSKEKLTRFRNSSKKMNWYGSAKKL